jgi:hypothetical protein
MVIMIDTQDREARDTSHDNTQLKQFAIYITTTLNNPTLVELFVPYIFHTAGITDCDIVTARMSTWQMKEGSMAPVLVCG